MRRRDACGRAFDTPVDEARRADIGVAGDPEGHDAAAKGPHPRRNPLVVRVRDQHRRRVSALEDFRLRVGDRVERREKPEVCFTDVRPHPQVRPGDAHQRADLSSVIHAQFDNGDLRPLSQLDERQRQPDVVVEVPAVADHPVPPFEKIARHFLRRGLAGAAGDGHDSSARLAPNAVRQRLQCRGRVVDLDHDRLKTPALA